MKISIVAILLVSLARVRPAAADVLLGPFDFNSAQFGNTLSSSDGGAHANTNWLNTANANPGSPGFLTGPNFNTGIANIGLFGVVSYTIGYNTPIVNGAGNDFGVVVARFSSNPVDLELSTNGGSTFTPLSTIPAATAVATGVNRTYFYNGVGGNQAELFVHPLDLTSFGIAANAAVNSIRVRSATELDLVRIAGFARIPEPTSILLSIFAAGLGCAFTGRRTR